MPPAPDPRGRLGTFYFFYFAALGVMMPYWALYLSSLKLTPPEIGTVIALMAAGRVIAPLLAGAAADFHGHRMGIVRGSLGVASLSFLAVWWADDFATLIPTSLIFGFFFSACMPQFEATTLAHLGTTPEAYSRVRLWGSVGFIIGVAGIGAALDRTGTGLIPAMVMLLLTVTTLVATWVPEAPGVAHPPAPAFLRQLLTPAVVALLASSFLIQVAHGPYYTFFTLYLQGYGYSPLVAGGLWSLGVVAEIVLFLAAPFLLARYSRQTLYGTALLLAAGRWILIATTAQSPTLVIIAQCLHAASFGLHHTIAIQLIHHHFPSRSQGLAMAMYSAMSFGAGGALGSFLAGLGWESLGPEGVFLAAAVVTLAAFLIGCGGREPGRP
jgi:PPP family 3-phenylpropionic acid transporter